MKNKKAKSSLVEGPRPVTEMSLGEIQGYISMHETNIEGSKRKLEELNGEIRRRFEDVLVDALSKQDKQSGQHTFEAEGFKFTGEIKSTIKWDSPALERIAMQLPYDQMRNTFKIEFSVPEKVFKSITDQKLVDLLIEARTVKYSDPKIIFSA
ncbi:hypothetical protein UFOVP549_39 [uncultured Caudovirales phage]|uniref:Uncharacterized protein n=1 Tax=uncultured Caudovirales phage TaxID=2100421 RepID=A0A6J5MYL0_9CAUD|nr:hypothetical protein UFOVP549_39 [uncultured Caudovirales phage]